MLLPVIWFGVVAVALLAITYSLLSNRAARANVSAAMLFLAAGAMFFVFGDRVAVESSQLHLLAEITLVFVLFHDASTVQLRRLRSDIGLPVRLLGIGFPLALVATALVSSLVLPELTVAAAILLAASITPTDAGLGAATVLDPVVPLRIRRALNVESGLNDGLATPVVLIALAAVGGSEGDSTLPIFSVTVLPVVLALVVGLGVAAVVALGLDASRRVRASNARTRSITVLLIPVVCFAICELASANIFIAAFVAGLTFGAMSSTDAEEPEVSELLETAADLLSYVVWFLAGSLIALVISTGFSWKWALVAVLTLTVLRMVPVGLSLIGSKLPWPSVSFIGWFGPRGLATVIFGLLTVEELGTEQPIVRTIVGVISLVVVMSVVAHGISAAPLARRYGRWAQGRASAGDYVDSAEPRSRGHLGSRGSRSGSTDATRSH
ncbi:MAG: cation:proton antiporter [Candidatus Nanopelagicales bacterium]